MDFLQMAKDRYSERRFEQTPVEQEKLDRILEAGRISPTARNLQPQRFYIIRSEEAKAKVREATRYHYHAPLSILVCYDKNETWKNPADRNFKDYDSGEQDASISATHMMFAAWEIGVHSVWVRDFDSKKMAEVFGLPDNIIPAVLLPMGYPQEGSEPNKWHFSKKPMEEFVKEL